MTGRSPRRTVEIKHLIRQEEKSRKEAVLQTENALRELSRAEAAVYCAKIALVQRDFAGGHVTVWQVYGRPLQ